MGSELFDKQFHSLPVEVELISFIDMGQYGLFALNQFLVMHSGFKIFNLKMQGTQFWNPFSTVGL